MALLKIRDENGNVHSIASIKGPKGDGVPDGGTVGQVIKKTADGTEWGDVTTFPEDGYTGQVLKKTESGVTWANMVKGEVWFENDDPAIDSCSFGYSGLYEVTMVCNTDDGGEISSQHTHRCKCLISVFDASGPIDENRFVIGSYLDNGIRYDREAFILVGDNRIRALYNHMIVNGDTVEAIPINRAYLEKVILVLPYYYY